MRTAATGTAAGAAPAGIPIGGFIRRLGGNGWLGRNGRLGRFFLFNLLLCLFRIHQHFKGFGAGGLAVRLDRAVRVAVYNAVFLAGADTGFVHLGERAVIGKAGDAGAGGVMVALANGTHQHTDHFHTGDGFVRLEFRAEIVLLDDSRDDERFNIRLRPVSGNVGEA